MKNFKKNFNLLIIVGVLSPLSMVISLPPLFGDWIQEEKQNQAIIKYKSIADIIVLSFAFTFLTLGNVCLLFKLMAKGTKMNTILSIVFHLLHVMLYTITIGRFLILNEGIQYKNLSGDFIVAFVATFISMINSALLMTQYLLHIKQINNGIAAMISNKQRMFIYFDILVSTWCVLGGISFSLLENWSLTRGLYFTLVTMTTIGFGDFKPTKTASKIILFFYALIGIALMGLFINSMRVVVVEFLQKKYTNKVETITLNRFETITPRIYTLFKAKNSSDKTQVAINIEKDNMESEERIKKKHERKILKRQLEFSALFFIMFWLLGAIIFKFTEGWTYFESFYFCFISFTTIGYGDLTVKSFLGLVVFIVYMFIGLVAVAYLLFIISEIWENSVRKRSEKINLKTRASENEIKAKHKISTAKLKDLLVENNENDTNLQNIIKELNINLEDEGLDLIWKIKNIAKLYHYYSFECIDNGDDTKNRAAKCARILEKLIEKCDKTIALKTDQPL